MKKLPVLLSLCLLFQELAAQFNGVLHYENDYASGPWFKTAGKVLTTISESGPLIRIEALDTNYTNSRVTKQNTLLVDVGKGTEIHLVDMAQRAIVYSITGHEKQAETLNAATHTVYNFENAGMEQIGNFQCTHYVMTKSYAKLKGMKPARFDIWITKDLGSCNVWYVGKYLYFFSPAELYKRLAAVGADGVVVQWKETTSNTTTCVLTGYELKQLRAPVFTPPSGYTITNVPVFPVSK